MKINDLPSQKPLIPWGKSMHVFFQGANNANFIKGESLHLKSALVTSLMKLNSYIVSMIKKRHESINFKWGRKRM